MINNFLIKPGYLSDHSIILLKLDLIGTQATGKGSWKFINNMLNDPTYTALIKNMLADIKNI